jgi:urease accessory protein
MSPSVDPTQSIRMRRLILFCATLVLLATPAAAHTGSGGTSSFLAGLMHPISGLDHVATMFAVGAWSAVAGGARLWTWPAAFIVAMLCGALAGSFGPALPYVEPLIAASVIAAGLLLLLAARLPVAFGVALVAGFALVHGHAHGTEAPAGSLGPYLAGFSLATSALHVAGMASVEAMRRLGGMIPVRATGAAIAATGTALLLS